jgi:hypothetical protein
MNPHLKIEMWGTRHSAASSVLVGRDVSAIANTYNCCALDRAAFRRFCGADHEIAKEVDGGRGRCVEGFVFDTRFEPFTNPIPGGVVWLVFVMSSDVPDAELTIAAVQVGAAVNRHAVIFRLYRLGEEKSQNQEEMCSHE